jgi:hypothetical protein
MLHLVLIVLISAGTPNVVNAQQVASTSSGSDETRQAIDQLVQQNQKLEQQNRRLEEQNRQLEEQNRLLIQKFDSIRPPVASTEKTSQPTEAPAKTSAPLAASPSVAPASAAATPQAQAASSAQPSQEIRDDDRTKLADGYGGNPAIFGEFNPGRGFTVAQGEFGKLDLSGYMVARYLNQLPPDQTATDHLGRPITVTPRNDFQFHRVMLFSQGWLFSKKFNYSTFLWTVQDTNQVAVGGALYYSFNKLMTLGGGWNAYPGTMSLQGSHPYWTSYDRVMADEYFRPYFSQGVFAQGNLTAALQYRWMVGNNNSNLDVPAVKLDRDLSGGFAFTWLPTTHEFGPRGAFGDFENHQKLATRFNLAYTYSPENRQAALGSPTGNTTLRIGDSLNIFDPNTFANGVTVTDAHYKLLAVSTGMKYHGFWLQGEGYGRRLDNFKANGPLPMSVVRDTGFYVQLADMIIQKKLEIYGATSYIFPQYGHPPKEFIVGSNLYFWRSRNVRLNMQLINVDHSPVSSTFGFYNGQITGQVFSFGMTALY